jgi:hypothetical protein
MERINDQLITYHPHKRPEKPVHKPEAMSTATIDETFTNYGPTPEARLPHLLT